MYKYQVINELSNLKPVNKELFEKKINRATLKCNVIIVDKQDKHYFCTNCRKYHNLSSKECKKIRYGQFIKCSNCNHKFKIVYPRNKIQCYEGYIVYFEVNDRKEVILRNFYFNKNFENNITDVLEVNRANIDRRINTKKNTISNMGYIIHRADNKPWKKYNYIYGYSRLCANNGLKKLLKGTKLQYACLDIITKHNIEITGYINAYNRNDKLELLAKAGCYRLIEDVIFHYRSLYNLKKSTFKVIAKYDLNYSEATLYEKFPTIDINHIKKLVEKGVAADDISMYGNHVSNIVDYMIDKDLWPHDYRDYYTWLNYLGIPKTKETLYPKDFKNAHDDLEEKYTRVKDIKVTEGIANYSKELEKYTFKNDGLIIIPAHSQDELINESKELNHCVRTYTDKVANKLTAIFFIRQINDIDKPFITLELKDNEIIQARGKHNVDPPSYVQKFIEKWEMEYGFSGYGII